MDLDSKTVDLLAYEFIKKVAPEDLDQVMEAVKCRYLKYKEGIANEHSQ